jgi:HEPN domain-containing protein
MDGDGGIGEKIFQQVMDIFIIPEIERRKKDGRIKENFILRAGQIVLSRDKGNSVRLNEEVKAIAKSIAAKSIKKNQLVFEDDIKNIEKVELIGEDKNYAHITLLLFKNKWLIFTDFRYDMEDSSQHLHASKEFYNSAIENLKNKRLRPFYENSFAAAELSTKASLMLFVDKKNLNNHENRTKNLEKWAELGNIPKIFSDTLKKLATSIRYSARYLQGEDFKTEDPNKIITIIKEMIDFAEKGIK